MVLSPHNARHMAVHGHFAPRERRRKVLIYGAGMYREAAPLQDPAWDVWALNLIAPTYVDAGVTHLRCDRWFDLHQRHAQTADDLRWIAKCPAPIYVPDDLLGAGPNCVRFPLREVEKVYGSYFTCTFCYQIALVLWEGEATDVALYGVELAYGTPRERTVEWAGTMYWLGRAAERGIRIHVPRDSTLRAHLAGAYSIEELAGYHEPSPASGARYGIEYDAEKRQVERYLALMERLDGSRKGSEGMGG